MNHPYLSCLKSYWAEILNLSWLPPKILLAHILMLLWQSLILVFFNLFSVCNLFSNPWAGPQSRSCHLFHKTWPLSMMSYRVLYRIISRYWMDVVSYRYLSVSHFEFYIEWYRLECLFLYRRGMVLKAGTASSADKKSWYW